MDTLHDLSILLVLIAAIGLWLKLSAARERASTEARRQCERYGLQLLDESVGLRSVRLRRIAGSLRLERCYSFEVSIDGADREQASLWMLGDALSELRLPTVVLMPPEQDAPRSLEATSRPAPTALLDDTASEAASGSNVIPLRRRRYSEGNDTLH